MTNALEVHQSDEGGKTKAILQYDKRTEDCPDAFQPTENIYFGWG